MKSRAPKIERVTVTNATKAKDTSGSVRVCRVRVSSLSIGRRYYQTTSMWLWMAGTAYHQHHLLVPRLHFTENNWKYNKSLQCHVTRINLLRQVHGTRQSRSTLPLYRVYDKFSVKQLPPPPPTRTHTHRHTSTHIFDRHSDPFSNHLQMLCWCCGYFVWNIPRAPRPERTNEDEYVTIIILINYNCSPNACLRFQSNHLALRERECGSESLNNSP